MLPNPILLGAVSTFPFSVCVIIWNNYYFQCSHFLVNGSFETITNHPPGTRFTFEVSRFILSPNDLFQRAVGKALFACRASSFPPSPCAAANTLTNSPLSTKLHIYTCLQRCDGKYFPKPFQHITFNVRSDRKLQMWGPYYPLSVCKSNSHLLLDEQSYDWVSPCLRKAAHIIWMPPVTRQPCHPSLWHAFIYAVIRECKRATWSQAAVCGEISNRLIKLALILMWLQKGSSASLEQAGIEWEKGLSQDIPVQETYIDFRST